MHGLSQEDGRLGKGSLFTSLWLWETEPHTATPARVPGACGLLLSFSFSVESSSFLCSVGGYIQPTPKLRRPHQTNQSNPMRAPRRVVQTRIFPAGLRSFSVRDATDRARIFPTLQVQSFTRVLMRITIAVSTLKLFTMERKQRLAATAIQRMATSRQCCPPAIQTPP